MSDYVLAIDQGTTSSRAVLFDDAHVPVATAGKEFAQHFPLLVLLPWAHSTPDRREISMRSNVSFGHFTDGAI